MSVGLKPRAKERWSSQHSTFVALVQPGGFSPGIKGVVTRKADISPNAKLLVSIKSIVANIARFAGRNKFSPRDMGPPGMVARGTSKLPQFCGTH